jgi:hypothetical protein
MDPINSNTHKTVTSRTLLRTACPTHTLYALQRLIGHSAPSQYAMGALIKGHKLDLIPFSAEPMGENEVFVDILFCGMCHSDLHKVCDDWKDFNKYPMVPGHEVVGIVKCAGQKVKHLKVGDRVGFGPQRECCHTCGPCTEKAENVCEFLPSNLPFTFHVNHVCILHRPFLRRPVRPSLWRLCHVHHGVRRFRVSHPGRDPKRGRWPIALRWSNDVCSPIALRQVRGQGWHRGHRRAWTYGAAVRTVRVRAGDL